MNEPAMHERLDISVKAGPETQIDATAEEKLKKDLGDLISKNLPGVLLGAAGGLAISLIINSKK